MPDLELEHACGGVVCGIDEVGRGPWAGPVIAAAVVLPDELPPRLLAELNDSKKLSARRREEMAELLHGCARIGLGRAEVAEIDRLNILQATFLAMTRAVAALGIPVDHALIDGNQKPPLDCAMQCIVKGDGKSLSIAAASVVAKVARDRLMAELARDFPGYGWERNAGYGTAQHQRGLAERGVTPHHRRSFAPIKALLAELDS